MNTNRLFVISFTIFSLNLIALILKTVVMSFPNIFMLITVFLLSSLSMLLLMVTVRGIFIKLSVGTILIGQSMNLLVMIINGGYMPCLVYDYDLAPIYVAATSATKLAFLGDNHSFLFLSGFSLGDVVLIAGTTITFIYGVHIIWRIIRGHDSNVLLRVL